MERVIIIVFCVIFADAFSRAEDALKMAGSITGKALTHEDSVDLCHREQLFAILVGGPEGESSGVVITKNRFITAYSAVKDPLNYPRVLIQCSTVPYSMTFARIKRVVDFRSIAVVKFQEKLNRRLCPLLAEISFSQAFPQSGDDVMIAGWKNVKIENIQPYHILNMNLTVSKRKSVVVETISNNIFLRYGDDDKTFKNRKGDPLFFEGYLAGVLIHIDDVRKQAKYQRITKGDPPDAIILHQVD